MSILQVNKQYPLRALSKSILIIVALVFLLAICSTISAGDFLYELLIQNPKEPVASGIFPRELVWSFDVNETIASTPITNGKHIFIRTEKSIYAVDNDGKILWRTDSEAIGKIDEAIPTLKPQIAGIYLIVPESDSQIAIFSLDTGRLMWRSQPSEYSHGNIESITANQEMLYVARWNWELTAYDLQTGRTMWEIDLASRSNPYVTSDVDTVYLGQEHILQSFEAETGVLQWELDFGGYSGPIILDGNILYMADERNSRVLAIDTSTQGILWEEIYPQIQPYEFNCIVLSGDVLYIAAQQLAAINKINGHPIWTSQGTGRLECPSIYSNSIFVRNTEKALFKLNAQTGEETGQLAVQVNTTMKHEPERSPLIFENLLIVPFGDDRVFAYQLNQ